MNILISGGSGLVGRALVEELSSAGHRCTVLSRTPARVTDMGEGVDVHPWDAFSSDPLLDLISHCDAVVHLAGESIGAGRWTAKRKKRILESRVLSTQAMTAAVMAVSSLPEVFLQASAVGYYGPQGDAEIGEEASPGDDFLASVCRDWEAASEGIAEAGVRRVLLRTGIVLSLSGGALPKMALPFRFFAGGPAGNGRHWLPWIHLNDEVGAIRFLLEHPTASGAFNLTAPNPVTNRDFSRLLGQVLHRPSLLPAPAFGLRLLLGEMADLLLTGQRAVPKRLLDLGYPFRFPDLEPALRDIFSA